MLFEKEKNQHVAETSAQQIAAMKNKHKKHTKADTDSRDDVSVSSSGSKMSLNDINLEETQSNASSRTGSSDGVSEDDGDVSDDSDDVSSDEEESSDSDSSDVSSDTDSSDSESDEDATTEKFDEMSNGSKQPTATTAACTDT